MKQRGQIVTNKILDTADRLFYSQGYNNTGINQVIDEADIAKGSLYKHFESKADLMVAYLERLHHQWFERLKAHVDKQPDPKLKLLAVLEHHRNRQQVREFGGCPFIRANTEAGSTDSRISLEIQQTKEKLRKFVGQLVAKSGHKKILTNAELTETILLMIEGGIALGSVFKNDHDMQKARRIIQRFI
jgi:AcrR family transcriptional regulator